MSSKFLKSQPHLIAGLCFLLLTLVMTWPVATRLNTHITPGQQPVMTVPYLNAWTLAWNHHWLKGETDTYWNGNLFHPHEKTLAYSEPQFGMGLLTFPLALLGANTVLMYNLLLLGLVWGTGMTAYTLCWYLFGAHVTLISSQVKLTEDRVSSPLSGYQKYRWTASVTAGILYGFHFYMFYEMGTLQLMATLFPPLTFLALHRFVDNNSWIDAVLVCVGFLGCWYTCGYYGLFLSLFVVCFVLKSGYRNLLTWKIAMRGAVIGAIILVCLVPLIMGMQSAKTAMELSRPTAVVWSLSAMVSDYLKFPQTNWLYGKILRLGSPDHGLFFGAMLICLSVIGTTVLFREQLLGNTAPARPDVDRETKRPQFDQRLRFSRHWGFFYFAMAGLAFWFSLGIALTPTNATGLGIYRFIAWLSPYNLLFQFVPGFSLIRAPYRFSIFCVLFLSVLAGWGSLWLTQHVAASRRSLLAIGLLIAALLELWPLPLRLVKIPNSIETLPPIYQEIKKLPPESALIELPLARGPSERQLETEARSLYYSTFHWQKIANGYSGFFPRASIELNKVISDSDSETILSAIKAFDIGYVLTHEDTLNTQEKMKLSALEGEGLTLMGRDGNNQLYRVTTAASASTDPVSKVPLPTVEEVSGFLPSIEMLTFYESKRSPNHVTLCFHYQVNNNQCRLTTPWENRVECQVNWYPTPKQHTPILVSEGVYHNSKLITQTFNTLEFDLRAPPPGEYSVKVQQRNVSDTHIFKARARQQVPIEMDVLTTNGICRIHENGFVTFYSTD